MLNCNIFFYLYPVCIGPVQACAKCFFAYVGFDGIAAAGEEATNPRKSIPIATIITMVVVSSVYISVSGVLTLMRPYYDIDPDAGTAFKDFTLDTVRTSSIFINVNSR